MTVTNLFNYLQVDPLVSLMMVEKVPDSTYENVGGLDKQIKEIKEVIELPVKHPELFDALGIAQPKVSENLLTFNSSFVIVALLNILSVDYLLR